MRRVLFTMFLGFSLICCLASESPAIMKALTTEKLTRNSMIVILGEVEDLQCQWNENGEKIVSCATVAITEVIRGNSINKRLVVEYEGGEVGEIGLKVSDVSPLMKREKVLLFLKPMKNDKNINRFNMVGKAQGKYTIDDNGIARKRGFAVMGEKWRIDNDISLEELIRKIKEVATAVP